MPERAGQRGEETVGRFFLAVDLPDATRAALDRHLQDGLDRTPLPGRSVPAANWHLTLRFLGATGLDALERLAAELEADALGSMFTLRFGGLGAFPRAARASVLWLGVRDGAAELSRLAEHLEVAARRSGFPAEERRFSPHLTLSRLRPAQDVRSVIERVPEFDHEVGVHEVVLFRSHLGSGPARYEPLARYRLG